MNGKGDERRPAAVSGDHVRAEHDRILPPRRSGPTAREVAELLPAGYDIGIAHHLFPAAHRHGLVTRDGRLKPDAIRAALESEP